MKSNIENLLLQKVTILKGRLAKQPYCTPFDNQELFHFKNSIDELFEISTELLKKSNINNYKEK